MIESDKPVEFLYKKSKYIFPAKSKIFSNGSKLIVEISNKKVRSISRYLAEKTNDIVLNYKVGLPITPFGSQINKEYQSIMDYLSKNPTFDFLHFEYATSHDLALCAFFKSENLIRTDNLTQEIDKKMPYMVNIFKRPLIHLKETETIQPVDTVKRINYNTVRHLFRHPENWKDIKNSNIVPAKLLTKVYDDDYGIYENIVFRDLVDKLMAFLRQNIYHLMEIFDTFKEWVQLDAINRFNHPKYYLAIGKLYLGFTKKESTSELSDILERVKHLYKKIKENLSRAIYTKNVYVKPLSGDIKRTNILAMHKDYKHIYSLYRQFNQQIIELNESGDYLLQCKSQTGYEQFCQMLTLFAASNFIMSCEPGDIVYKDGKLNAYLQYKNWVLTLTSEYDEILDLNVIVANIKNDKPIKYLIIPMSYYIGQDKKKQYENIIKKLYYSRKVYDKYVFLEPFYFGSNSHYSYSTKYSVEDFSLFYAVLPVSISEVNSFRRIQKLLFEGLVLNDNEHTVCAFCGEKLIEEKDGKYLCHKCRTAVRIISCKHCKKEFKATYFDVIKRKKYKKEKEEDYLKDLSDFYKQEKRHSFRNITNITENGFVCPYCGEEKNS